MAKNPLIRSLAQQADGERQESQVWQIPKLLPDGKDSRVEIESEEGLVITLAGSTYYAVNHSRKWAKRVTGKRYVAMYFEGLLRFSYDKQQPVLIIHEITRA